jgi:DNA-binding CsgD family transcriptional regulator/PAS domain-containing protein
MNDLIQYVYASVEDHTKWTDMLFLLGDILHARSVHFLYFDAADAAANVQYVSGLDESDLRAYHSHYANLDVWVTRAPLTQAGAAGLSHAQCDNTELVRTEFYNDYMRPRGLHYGMGANILADSGGMSILSMFRPESRGPCNETELCIFRILIPHLQQALRLQSRIAGITKESNWMRSALNSLREALVLTDRTGKVLMMNDSAERLLGENDGLSIRRGVLSASVSETTHLHQAIAHAAACAAGNNAFSGSTTMISRRSLRRGYSVTVIPVRPSEGTVAVFIKDPERSSRDLPAHVRMYGLSPAETRLCELIIQGGSLPEAAARLGLSYHTVRTQMKSIFNKTGVSRRSELVRLLMTGA